MGFTFDAFTESASHEFQESLGHERQASGFTPPQIFVATKSKNAYHYRYGLRTDAFNDDAGHLLVGPDNRRWLNKVVRSEILTLSEAYLTGATGLIGAWQQSATAVNRWTGDTQHTNTDNSPWTPANPFTLSTNDVRDGVYIDWTRVGIEVKQNDDQSIVVVEHSALIQSGDDIAHNGTIYGTSDTTTTYSNPHTEADFWTEFSTLWAAMPIEQIPRGKGVTLRFNSLGLVDIATGGTGAPGAARIEVDYNDYPTGPYIPTPTFGFDGVLSLSACTNVQWEWKIFSWDIDAQTTHSALDPWPFDPSKFFLQSIMGDNRLWYGNSFKDTTERQHLRLFRYPQSPNEVNNPPPEHLLVSPDFAVPALPEIATSYQPVDAQT